tara:strand:+ start:7428 stop:7799 length:372 start_codon:yes stop_codon:yes gene_type:complete
MEFITRIVSEDITEYGIESVVPDIKSMNYDVEAIAQVSWSFHTETKDWGVKDISVVTEHIAIEIQVNIWGDDQKGDSVEFVNINTEDGDWKIEDSIYEIKLGDVIIPQDIEIDFNSKTIQINF